MPSKTFTIDVPVQAADGNLPDGKDPLDSLKELHAGVIESLVSDDDDDSNNGDADADFLGLLAAAPLRAGTAAAVASSLAASGSASSKSSAFTTSSSSSWAQNSSSSSGSSSTPSTHGFGRYQPQFNLDSATFLLTSFREDMLPYFPVVVLPPPGPSGSVPSLARERPFVLLAILAAASSVRSLQGHGLYDDEFRRVLGLKYVSGGERSLELLVGLLIYCAW